MRTSVLMIAASVLTALALGLVFSAWRARPAPRSGRRAVGWLLLVVAAVSWIGATGWEFGLVYTITVPSLFAGAFVLGNVERRAASSGGARRGSLGRPGAGALGRNAGLLVMVVPLACAAATLPTIALALRLPLDEVDRLVFVACAMPVGWALTAFWAASDPRRLRPFLALSTVAALAYLSILMIPLP